MSYPYMSSDLSPAERAADLLSRMDLEEKLAQLQCCMPAMVKEGQIGKDFPHGVGQVAGLAVSVTSRTGAPGVARRVREIQEEIMAAGAHHIPAIFHIETLCGVLMPGATSFGTGIAQGATWDPALHYEIAALMREQAKAVGLRQAFSPVLDVAVDPRFGRQGESHSEDPTLCAAMGTAQTRGLQADGDLKNAVAATSKHYLAYHAAAGGIHAGHAHVGYRDLRETYAKPFQAAIAKGGLRSVMNSYGSIDGDPVIGSKKLLTGLLREEMGFEGLTVSDYTSVTELQTKHKVAATPAEAGLRALKAGMDCELPGKACYDAMAELFRQGRGDMAALDAAVLRHLTLKFELGLFENPFPDETAIAAAFDEVRGHALALQEAREALVLLKNDGVLPLDLRGKRVALVGYHGASTVALFGGYTMVSMSESFLGAMSTMDGTGGVDVTQVWNAQRDSSVFHGTRVKRENPNLEAHIKGYAPRTKNLFEQLKAAGADVRYAYGYDYAGDDESRHDEALALCADSDVVIVTLGGKYGWSNTCTTGEGIDSTCVTLPPCQERFLRKLAALGKPAVGLHFDGRPISSDAADEVLNAIVECWNPGEGGSEAIVEVLTGAVDPSGRLPVSVVYTEGQIPLSYRHPNGGSYHVTSDQENGESQRSYIDRPLTPRYCFGHGLSYTDFAYGELTLNTAEVAPDGEIVTAVPVTNTGDRAGIEVVQLYASDPVASMVRPALELVGFCRVMLQPGETKTVEFRLQPSQMAFLDEDERWKIEAGELRLHTARSSRDLRSSAGVTITADRWIDGKTRAFWAECRTR